MKNVLAGVLCTLALVACGDDSETDGSGGAGTTTAVTTSTSGTGGSGGSGGSGPITTDFQAGGDRPVTVQVPPGYDPAVPAPLVILLHGYTATGTIQNAYFGLQTLTDAQGIVYAYPDGTVDGGGENFWNATDACCNFYGSTVDDEGYLSGLIDEITSKVSIDPKRVYFVGHSNGGFMSYRMACKASDKVAAIVSLAGANFGDPADCGATNPVSVLQIHGDLDDTILYSGGAIGPTSYPSAHASVAYFAALNGCDATPQPTGMSLDLDSAVAGDETAVEVHANCTAGYAAEVWSLAGGGHVPTVTAAFGENVLQFLLAHPKP